MLFSATLENEIETLVERYLKDPVTHEVDPSAGAVTTMTHHVLVVKPKDKAPITNAIAARKGRTIVFVRTQMGADRVAQQLRDAGVKADALHGGMTQGARTRTLGDFKDGYVNVLVATDVAARGIHVDGIDLVLNVDPAGDHKDYLHRSGRTARAGRSGTVVTLILPHQRRSTFRLLEDAGVEASRHIVGAAFDADVARITGARSLTEVQAESAANAAKQAEREVVELTKELERATRHAAGLREDAERLAARAARERAELGLDAEPAEGTDAEAADGQVELTAVQPAEGGDGPAVAETRAPREERYERAERTERFERRDREDRREDRFERRDRDGDRGGFRRDRDGDRGGFQRRDDRDGDRGGFRRDREDRFERRDRDGDRGGFRRDRDGDRGGFQRRDDRDGDRGGFQRRDDRDGGFRRDRDGDRGGFRRDRDDHRGGFQRRDDRDGGFRRDRDRDDRRPSFGRRDDHRPAGSGGFQRRDDRGGFQRRDDRGPRGFGGSGAGERKPRWKN
ncbi:helicase-related protein [Streptacidiphilus monticola]